MGPFFRDAFSLHCLIDFSTQSISGKMFWYTVGLKHYFTFSNITKELAEKWKLKKMRGKTEITVAFQLAVCFILVARTIIKKKNMCCTLYTHPPNPVSNSVPIPKSYGNCRRQCLCIHVKLFSIFHATNKET